MATSAGITSAVLIDLGAGDRPATRTILGAAVVDDVLALMLLSVVVGIADGGGRELTASAACCWPRWCSSASSRSAAPPAAAATRKCSQAPSFTESGLLPAVMACLGLAALAGEIGLTASSVRSWPA